MEPGSYLTMNTIIALSDQGILSPWVITAICLLIILLILSVIFTGSESAYFSLEEQETQDLENLKSVRSLKVLKLLSAPEELLVTIIISNTLINLLFITLFASLLNIFPAFALSSGSGIALSILVIVFTLLIFGKILPKIYAHNNALRFAIFAVYPLVAASWTFTPLRFLLNRTSSMINRRIVKNLTRFSIDGLSDALDHTNGVVTEDRKILMGIVNFSNIEVSDIMKPRMDVTAVDIETDFKTLIKTINDSGYSRIPVFSETFDNIKGVLYVKDLLPFLSEKDNFEWQNLIRPGYYVPETKKIKDLLQEFLDKKIHMAIVVDEYGGTEGIVTLEDILEEIVGEINDESDEVESNYSRIDDYNYIFDGKILLNDFFKIVQLDEDLFEPIRGEADTLAGLILEIKGEIPPPNDTILLKNFSFTILSVDERRIRKVKFTLDKNLKIRQ